MIFKRIFFVRPQNCQIRDNNRRNLGAGLDVIPRLNQHSWLLFHFETAEDVIDRFCFWNALLVTKVFWCNNAGYGFHPGVDLGFPQRGVSIL